MPDEFEPAGENPALKDAIIARIQADGAITFRDFMAMALYHPQLGYYAAPRETMGRSGDYLTSPEVSPVFGAVLGRQLHEMWELMDRPAGSQLVEAGAGSGSLCRSILRWARRTAPDFFDAVTYHIIEESPLASERQQAVLNAEGFGDNIRWLTALPEGVSGCILSNELLDSMPVHRVTVRDGRLLEVFVSWDGSRFTEELREPSTPAIEEYFRALDQLPGEGCTAEVNLEAPQWIQKAGRALTRGFLLTLDYGYEAEDLFAPWRTEGTLLCFYRHNPGRDPYVRIGRQDITAHVDFTSVRRAAHEAGLQTLGEISQSQFLANLGILNALAPPEGGQPDLEEYFDRRRAVMELLDPGGLGRIRVLVQAKGTGDVALTGLREGGE